MTFRHNNRLDKEMEFARANREYLEEQRGEIEEAPVEIINEGRDKKEGRKTNKLCCWGILIITALAVFIIYYFVINIKDVVIRDYFKKKGQVEELLPQGKDEIKKSIEQGESLITETQKSVKDAQDKYQKTKETIEDVQQKYDQAKETYDEVKSAKENIEKMLK